LSPATPGRQREFSRLALIRTPSARRCDAFGSGFTISFTDSNNSNLFNLGELEASSAFPFLAQADVVLAVPERAGISVAGWLDNSQRLTQQLQALVDFVVADRQRRH
jgi:hypothetical protein